MLFCVFRTAAQRSTAVMIRKMRRTNCVHGVPKVNLFHVHAGMIVEEKDNVHVHT